MSDEPEMDLDGREHEQVTYHSPDRLAPPSSDPQMAHASPSYRREGDQ